MHTIFIDALGGKTKISREIYGHFSEHLGRCIYDGLFVGKDSDIPNIDGVRKDAIEALRAIKIPVLRWPGGCFAEEYHWRDGIGPVENRPVTVNNYWGKVPESNHFGTHEFFNLCELLGAQPYLAANLSGGTVREMQDWVEYITFDGHSTLSDLRRKNGREKPWALPFIGIGNENWGGGGNMRPEYYADEYRKYQTFCKDYGDNRLKKIACGPSDDDYDWTEKLVKSIRRSKPFGISMHHYCVPTRNWDKKGSATAFSDDEYYSTIAHAIFMDELIQKHGAIIRRYDADIALIVDEWGVWCDTEPGTNPDFLYQQNSMRDAIVAAVTLNIFNNHADIVKMANLAQTVNVLQSVLLTDGKNMLKTPTYHVFDLFKAHQDSTLLPSHVAAPAKDDIPLMSCSASLTKNGEFVLTLCNASLTESMPLRCILDSADVSAIAEARVLTAPKEACNTFEVPDAVHPVSFDGCVLKDGCLSCTLPPVSVAEIVLK